jgi:radical SAM superfamily enzyme YgiQ (UPF0313 family)
LKLPLVVGNMLKDRIAADASIVGDDRYDHEGVRFVLTASAAEMGTYNNSWMNAMQAAFPEAFARPFIQRYLRSQDLPDGSARFAPYGLRKIESLLVNFYGKENVVVTHPSNLDRFVGTNTEAVLISTMDPLGLAYVSSTYNPIIGFGGASVNQAEFVKLCNNHVFKKFDHVKKIVGGFGVWQINDSGMQNRLGIDLLIAGECEEELIPLLQKFRRDPAAMQKYRRTTKLRSYEKVPLISRAASFGAVEITRGCGRRCQFCSPDYRTKYDFPIEHVMQEVATNVKYCCDSVYLVSEDVFLYGNDSRFNPSKEKLSKLLSLIANYPGVKELAFSHASLVPVLVDKDLLTTITPIIIEKSHYKRKGHKFIGADVGIESGSARLMRRYMSGKAYPLSIEKWPDIVVEGAGVMNDNLWYPMFTFVLGLPGETESDVLATLELLERLKGMIIFYVPLFFVPLEEAILRNARRASLEKISELHWEFIFECWKRNVDTWAQDLSPLVI